MTNPVEISKQIENLENLGFIVLPGDAIETTTILEEKSDTLQWSKNNPEPGTRINPASIRMEQSEMIAMMDDSVVLACCTWNCEVEPDGYCQHGNPSVLIALGLI